MNIKLIKDLKHFDSIIDESKSVSYDIWINGIQKHYTDNMYDTGEIFDIREIFEIGVNTVEYYYNNDSLYITIK